MPALRVLTFNVRSLRDDERAVASVIRSLDPHVVCIQEAPRFLRWRSTCAEMARRSGLVVVGGGRPAAANLILSDLAVEVVATHDVLLSRVPRLHRRGLALAHLRLAGVDFAIAGTHLDVEPAPRLRHVAEIERAIADWVPRGVPTIVAGDTNDDPGSEVWRALERERVDAWRQAHPDEIDTPLEVAGATSGPQDSPRRRIDAVFAPESLPVTSARVISSADVDRASDHRPLLVEFTIS